MSKGDELLNVVNLKKNRYTGFIRKKKTFSLGPLSFKVGKGELVYLKGENGSGKSTVLKLLVGLLIPDEGVISYQGGDWSKVIYLPEEVRPFLTLTPLEYLSFSFQHRNVQMRGGGLRALCQEALKGVQLEESCWRIPIRNLSKGGKKKILWAYVLNTPSQLYILDEPFCDLDERFKKKINNWIRGKIHRKEASFLLSTHTAEAALESAAKVIVLKKGGLL